MQQFFRLFYPVLYSVAAALYLPFYVWKAIFRRGGRMPLAQRLGRLPDRLSGLPAKKESRLWLHAVSVGEVNAVRPLALALEPSIGRLFVTTTTETGQKLARDLFPEFETFYFPLDWQWTCRRYLRALQPDAALLAETELWPGFIRSADRLGVALILVNGRISDRSYRRYRRIQPFIQPLLQTFDALCMQSRRDRERILQLGASPQRVHLTGNLKFDYQLAEDAAKRELTRRLARLLKPRSDDLLWVCGSTREGEEELLIEAWAELSRDFPRLKLLLAPRHPHRASHVAELFRQRGIPFALRSRQPWDSEDDPPALVLDSIGELAYVYEMADIVFVGGSLFPTGGHNIIEAANFGNPILFGPHMENFREISEVFLDSYAALRVGSHHELAPKIAELLKDEAARKWLGRNARKVVRDNQGAVRRTARIVLQRLGLPTEEPS